MTNAIPKTATISLSGDRQVTLTQFNSFNLMGIAAPVDTIVNKITIMAEAGEEATFMTVLSACRAEVFAIISEAMGVSVQKLAEDYTFQDILLIASTIYEINSGFFTEKEAVTPQ